MQPHIVVYNVLLAGLCVYAMARGGQPERLAALGWAIACMATLAMPFDPATTFHHVSVPRAAIDLAVLLWFIVIAAVANRFWPMWLAALHLIGTAVHGAKAYDPELLPSIYVFAISKIGYPILLVMVIGVMRHQERLRRFGRYRDWSMGAQAR